MGCSIQDQIRGYKTISKKLRELNPKVGPIDMQFAINDYWLGLENNMMTVDEKAVYKKLVEQTEGLARIGLGGKAQLNEAIVLLKEVDGDYIVHLESGKNYTFAKGKIKSKSTAKGQSVTMSAMELTSNTQLKGSDAKVRVGEAENDVATQGFDVDLGQALTGIWLDLYKADIDNGTLAQDKINLFNAYADPEKFQSDAPTLTEFDKLQSEILTTYQTTMAQLKTGDVAVDMFENDTEPTAGQINLKTQELKVRWNKMSRLSSSSEVFLHEVNHKMSSHVFAKNIGLKNLVKDLRDSANDAGLDYKVFLEGISNPTESEIRLAKMKFEYVFDKTSDPEEFYAYATTNENVYNAIKDIQVSTPLFKHVKLNKGKRQPLKIALNAVIGAINTVWRAITGRDKAGGELIAEMVKTIARVDAETTQQKETELRPEEGLSGLANAKIARLDDVIKPVIDKVADWTESMQGASSGKLSKQIKNIPVLNELMATGISQYLWRTVTQDTTKPGVADMYMIFRHSKQVVEKHTADIRNGVKTVSSDLYKGIDKNTKDAVTKVILEADLAQFEADEIVDYIDDKDILNNEIERLTKTLNNPDKELLEQIDGLVDYIVTGESTKLNQQLNANNIAFEVYKGIKGKKKKPSQDIGSIDKLVSLKALQKTASMDKMLIKKLIGSIEGKKAVDKTIKMYRSYIDNMREDATLDGYDPIPKGYTRPADGLLRYELIPEHEVKAQESILMKLVSNTPHMKVDGINYYLMTGRTKSVGFTEGAIGLISHTTEGIPISALLRRQNDMAGKGQVSDRELKRRTANVINSIAEGKTEKAKIVGAKALVPVYNHKREIVDYRIQLSKEEKEVNLPDRETELEDVLSSTFSRSIKTSLTATENKRVVDTIIENGSNGVLENPDDYVLIEEYTEEDAFNKVKREKRHDRWEYLPEHTKSYIFKKTRANGILIHKDFVELMTGEKDITIGNFAALGLDLKKYPVARARLMALESYVAEILGYVKQAMIVLNGDILVGNQVSNAMVAANHGINPVKYTKKFKERWQELNDYNEKVQMLAELEVKQMAGEDVKSKIAQLKKQLEGNVWDELVKDGQYTALVEDIDVEKKMDGQLAQQVQKYLDKSNFKGAIEGVKNGLYIDKTSGLYATMLKTVHYGDAITRQIIKEELEERLDKRWGFYGDVAKKETKLASPENKAKYAKEKQDINNYLDQLLVNYGYIPNRWWGYADKVLGLLFMKYYLNQPKAIMSMAKNNPTKVGLMQLGQYATGVDIADPINTYTNSGLDGIGYRWMLDDAPGLIAEPNIIDLLPSLNAAFVMR